ncbi:MAG: hypothetical protein J5524_10280 [Bacteroidaceae bacterium]|nr:hypothetical protein [Bacteroidaceae bacterium]
MKKLLISCMMFLMFQAANAYEVSVSMTQVNDSTWTFKVGLEENDLDFTAFQMDVALEGEAIVPEAGLACDTLMNNHQLMLGTPTGKYRIIGYSTASTAFKSQNGNLMSFTVKGNPSTISINKILFVEADATEHPATDLTAVTVEDPTAINGVSADAKNADSAYDMAGRKVTHLKDGAVFVIDGKKVLVK